MAQQSFAHVQYIGPHLSSTSHDAKVNDTFERVDSVTANDVPVIAFPKSALAITPTVPSSIARGTNVRVLGLHEWKAAAASLAEAFAVDDTSRYFVDTPDRASWSKEQKWALHVNIMEYITYAHLLKGLVVSAGPDYDCVGLWMPPGNNMDDYYTIFRSGMWRLNYQLSREGKKRFFDEFLPLLHDTKAQVLADRDENSWYLVYIGTKPSGRGKGYARAVIEHVTRRADRERRACYLESTHPVNRAIYGKLGFALQKSIYLQRACEHVELDIMVREPAVPIVSRR